VISKRKLFTLTSLLVGVHSLLLGVFIYFMTDFFYKLFFSTQVVNLFFVKQAGLFLFLSGLFYLVPLTNLEKLSRVTIVTIISKILAVLFLFTNASLTPSPLMIYLAGLGDACMVVALLVTYVMFIKETIPETAS
jgi:hypothetical protein